MSCTHERWDQIAALTAGHCPTCLLAEMERLRALIQKDYRPALSDAWELAEDRRDRIEAALAIAEEVAWTDDLETLLGRLVKALKGGECRSDKSVAAILRGEEE